MRPPEHSPRDLTDRVFRKTLENVHNLREFLEEALPDHVAALHDSSQRKEIHKMGQMIGKPWGEELLIEGEVRGHRKVLLQLLKDRFKKVPKAIKERIESTTDSARLERAIRKVHRLETLDDFQL